MLLFSTSPLVGTLPTCSTVRSLHAVVYRDYLNYFSWLGIPTLPTEVFLPTFSLISSDSGMASKTSRQHFSSPGHPSPFFSVYSSLDRQNSQPSPASSSSKHNLSALYRAIIKSAGDTGGISVTSMLQFRVFNLHSA